METPITAEQVVDIVWESFRRMLGGHFMFFGIELHMIYLIYGYHRQYSYMKEGKLSFRYIAEGDELLNDLYDNIKEKRPTPDLRMKDAYDDLSKVPHDEFEKIYPDVIAVLNDKINPEPLALTSLIAYFVNQSNCKSVYDPFCGTASIVHKLQDGINFAGQESNMGESLIARVNMEAHYGCDSGIVCRDTRKEWGDQHFDALVSSHLFGTYNRFRNPISEDQICNKMGFTFRYVEDLIIYKSFMARAQICVLLLTTNFLTSVYYYKLRRFLLDYNYLDTIISLPTNFLSRPSILIICKSHRKSQTPIKFISTEKYMTIEGGSKKKLNTKLLIETLKTNNPEAYTCVKRNIIRSVNYLYNLNFLYLILIFL